MAFMSVLSCKGKGPQVTVYISNPGSGGMDFYDEATGDKGFVPYANTDNLVCLNQVDLTSILDYYKISLNQKPAN